MNFVRFEEENKKLKKKAQELGIPVGVYKRLKAAFSVIQREYLSTQPESNKFTPAKKSLAEDKKEVQVIPESSPEDFVLETLKSKESNIKEFLDAYFEILPAEMRNSFAPSADLCKKVKQIADPQWFYFRHGKGVYLKSIEGLAVIGTVTPSSLKKRVVILHATTKNPTYLQILLKKLVEYIWKNVVCEDIRIELIHLVKEDAIIPYELYKNVLTENLGFKWVNCINEPQAQRKLELGLTRPSEFAEINNK